MASSTRTFTRPSNLMLTFTRVPRWPDPTRSIGVNDCGTGFHGKTLWAIQGPALDAYRTIEQDIECCIHELGVDLYANSPAADVPRSLGCFMWGQRKSNANPFIVISCSIGAVCQTIKKTIESHSWWEDFKQTHQGFGRFLLSAYPPHMLAAGGENDIEESNLKLTKVSICATVDALYSIPIHFGDTYSQERAATAQARLGGIVFSGASRYGLTVSHALRNTGIVERALIGPAGSGDLFYVDEDEDEDYEHDDADLGVMEVNEVTANGVESIVSAIQNDRDQSILATNHFKPLGNIVSHSENIDSTDWALIRFENEYLSQLESAILSPPRIVLGKQRLYDGTEEFIHAPKRFKALPQNTTSILMVGNRGKLIQGSLGASESLVWCAESQRYTRLATVLVAEPMGRGDCGMWIFDHHGNFYGHVVAGVSGVGVVYLTLAIRIVDSIQSDVRYPLKDLSLAPPFVSNGELLYNAISNGFVMDVDILLESGVDANEPYADGCFPLDLAVNLNMEHIVRLLLDRGANVDVDITQSGSTPLQRACEFGSIEIVQHLIDSGARIDVATNGMPVPLCIAARRGNEEVVKLFVDRGADINAQDKEYGTALQIASIEGHSGVVQMLLDAGADINTQGGQYSNALQTASVYGHSEVVQVLLNAGADANAQGGYYGNALQAASARNHRTVVQILLETVTDVNARGGYYNNALQAASARNHREVVQTLLNSGADVNAQGGQYGNALQAASVRGFIEVVRVLLNAGADVNAQGGQYGNALQAASARGHGEVVQILLSAGADVNAQGGHYDNALDAAWKQGRSKVKMMLLEAGAKHAAFTKGRT